MESSIESAQDRMLDGLAFVCEDLDAIRAQVSTEQGGIEVLDTLLQNARAGRDVTALLDDLHHVLQMSGDALGIYGAMRTSGGSQAHPRDMGTAHRAEVIYLCPARRCSRYAWADASPTAPTCRLDGAPLCAERL